MTAIKSILSTEFKLGSNLIKNRIIMAPLTRMRADSQLISSDLAATYYAQRASAGLIITEASQISQQGQGYPFTPGIYNAEQSKKWKSITDAVHEQGGLIFLQLWHVGRISHSVFQPQAQAPVAPSAIPAIGNAFLQDFSRVPYETPHALTQLEIQQIIADYRQAAIYAKEAGFDGVEIHAANGYLIEQFLRATSNQRTDEYGGTLENRSRFLFEVLDAVLSVWSNDQVGIRLSPYYTGSIELDENPLAIYDYVIQQLAPHSLAYLHIIENDRDNTLENNTDILDGFLVKRFRSFYPHPIIAAGGFDKWQAEQVIERGYADAVAFGRGFISTPDLPYRLLHDIPFNELDEDRIYGGDERGYTDYKTYISE